MIKAFRKFFADERGVAAPIIALSFMSLIAATGAAVDYARGQMVQQKLSDTLDSAGLAAGSTLSSQDPSDMVNNYFNVNFPQGYMDATLSPVTVTMNDAKDVLDLNASATVPTIFMKIMGINEMTVSAKSEITRKAGGLELVLVMDNTGSMAGSKLTALKSAATDLVDILFGSDSTKDKLWIGLVPFAQAVNIGTGYSSWINQTDYATKNFHGVPWAGCVMARTGGLDQTDDVPTTQKFKAYYWADDSNNDWLTNKGKLNSGIGANLGPNKYCSQQITEMTNQKSTILAGINNMQARGNTHIDLGAVWGWRMISPNWRGVWGGTMAANNLPLDYGTKNMAKAVVILSDGENTMSNSVFTAFDYLSKGVLGTTNATTAVNTLNARTTAVCNAMKSHGIIVYTIMFDLSNPSVETLFRNCASRPDYYFSSPTSAELSQAFHTIGDSLSNLRISK